MGLQIVYYFDLRSHKNYIGKKSDEYENIPLILFVNFLTYISYKLTDL